MARLPYTFYNIPDIVFENSSLSPYAKLVLAYLIKRESFLISQDKCKSGDWFPASYAAIASPLGVGEQVVRKKYVPQLEQAGLIETKTEQGFDRKEWIPKKTCMYRIVWGNIISKK